MRGSKLCDAEHLCGSLTRVGVMAGWSSEKWTGDGLQPRSGERMQATAQAVGEKWNENKPQRAKEKLRHRLHWFSLPLSSRSLWPDRCQQRYLWGPLRVPIASAYATLPNTRSRRTH